jgi:NTP pyrophosphatase (non-canonical NTP hydrolase)
VDTSEFQRDAVSTIPKYVVGKMLLSAAVGGMVEEAAEVLGLMNKHLYQGHQLDQEAMVAELGDTLRYAAWVCSWLGYGMDEVMKINMERMAERYPNGFDVERSVNR